MPRPDVILDRRPHHDPRSLGFPIRPLLAAIPTDRGRRRIWTPGPLLDQGREGACVGFGLAGELGATPVVDQVTNAFALDLYARAQTVDRAEGRDYGPDGGATVLAGIKAAQQLGLVASYRWCGVAGVPVIEDVIDAVIRHSPVVLGIRWLDGMYETRPDGLVEVSGPEVGGHCLYVHGWWPAHPQLGDVLVWQNSWGPAYGEVDVSTGHGTGRGFIRPADLEQLLATDGDAVVLTDRRAVRHSS
jgi:hypothetical protein